MPKNRDDDSRHDDGSVKVAVAIVLAGDKVLVGKRSADADLGGFDEFPGGKIEEHESPESAAMRECLEETRMLVTVDRRLDLVEHQYDHALVLIHFFLCSLADAAADSCGSPQPPFRWVPIAELAECEFPPANDAVIAALIRDH